MFEPFMRVALITGLLCLPVTENIRQKNVQPLQDAMEQLKSSVQSALPSEWKVISARADESLWPTVDKLRDRYKGYAIQLAGPNYKTETTPKGETETKTVTASRVAVLYFIPVWTGINRTQLIKDWNEGQRAMDSHFNMGSQQQSPSQQSESVAYGWNSRYLLICKHDCEIVQRVAKKFNIPKRP